MSIKTISLEGAGAGLLCLGICIGSGLGIYSLFNYIYPTKTYIAPNKVEQGYVVPSKLEIKVEDRVKKDSLPETYLNYKEKQFIFVEDANGTPVAIPYVNVETQN